MYTDIGFSVFDMCALCKHTFVFLSLGQQVGGIEQSALCLFFCHFVDESMYTHAGRQTDRQTDR